MDLYKRLTINKILEKKEKNMTWESASKLIVSAEKITEFAEASKTEYLRQLEHEQYIHSLS